MCIIPLTAESSNIDFIIYNLIMSKNGKCFTAKSLLEEIKKYNNNITEQSIQKKIEDIFLMQGLVRQKFDKYYVKRNGWKEIR
jgi:hypothetical protein